MLCKEEVENFVMFAPRGATLAYLEEIAESIAEIDGHRPLPPDITAKLQEEILYDRVHSSAVIEGNSLSRRETIVVLSSGIVEAGSRKDQLEVRNLADCCVYLQDCLDAREPLSVHMIKQVHQKLLQDIDDSASGNYRSVDVAISGAKSVPPSPLDVPHLVECAIDTVNKHPDAHPVQQAAYIHWALARIHPFKDGNGRLSRLIQDYVLLKCRYVPAAVQPEDREKNYYQALEDADLGDGLAFLEIVAKNTLRTAGRYLSIIRAEEEKSNWILSIAKAASEKVRETEHRKFVTLQKMSDELKFAFSTTTASLNDKLDGIWIGFKDYGGLDFEKYQDLKSKGKASRTWLFGLHLRSGAIDQRFIFWHAKHYRRPDDQQEFPEAMLNLLVSLEDSAGGYRALDEVVEDRITLREIIFDGRSMIRRRYNPVTKSSDWDYDVSPTDVCSHFIQEVFGKLGLI